MKRYLPLFVLLIAGAVAIGLIQYNRVDTQASPQQLLGALANAQHELTRVPVRMDRMTDAEEVDLGNKLAAHTAAALSNSTADHSRDAAVEAYLQAVGLRVAGNARRRLPWTFHYIRDPEFVNAFALPGGHIFVGQGLLSLMGSEDALASVLGHEVEHIDLRHCAERAQAEAHIRQLGPLGDLAGLPAELFMAGYSKEQEQEADRDGTTLAVQAGYSYDGILALFDEFRKQELRNSTQPQRPAGPVIEAAQLSLATLSGYFASHPPSLQRAEAVRRLAKERGWQTRPLRCPSAVIIPLASKVAAARNCE